MILMEEVRHVVSFKTCGILVHKATRGAMWQAYQPFLETTNHARVTPVWSEIFLH